MKRHGKTSGRGKFGTDIGYYWAILGMTMAVLMISMPVSALAQTHIWVDQERGSNGADVQGTETDPFKSITFAMLLTNNRGTLDPWVVHVKAGVYDADPEKPSGEREYFPIELRNGITIQGEDGAGNCIISGAFNENSSSAILRGQDVENITIKNLTLRDMYRTGGTQNGGGCELINCSGAIQGCISRDNYAEDHGGGLWLSIPDRKVFHLDGNTFIGNIADNYGGGMYVYGDFTGTIVGNTFSGNRAGGLGGGLYIPGTLTGDIFNNLFGTNYEGGFFIPTVIGNIYQNSFCGNDQGFSASLLEGKIEGNIFSMNSGGSHGAGFRLIADGGSPEDAIISNNIFYSNQSSSRGDAFSTDQNVTVVNNTFYRGEEEKSSVYLSSSATDCIFQNNIFKDVDTAIWESGEMDIPITHNNFDNVTNILNRNNAPMGDDLLLLDLMLSGFSNNSDWDAGMAGEDADAGFLTVPPEYDPDNYYTIVTDTNKSWSDRPWAGALFHVPGVGHFRIVGNTANQLMVQGNLEDTDIVGVGSTYTIDDFRLNTGSQNIDAGAVVGTDRDFTGDFRPKGDEFDIGAYEFDPGPVVTVADPNATDITLYSATIHGTVNPGGFATTCHFEYGTDTSYGMTTPNQNLGGGTSSITVQAQLTGLDPETAYHFRLVATNNQGTTYGPDQIFNTLLLSHKAIIVAGGGPFLGNSLWDDTVKCTNKAYNALLFQGYTKENIHYLSPDPAIDADGNGLNDDVDVVLTHQNLYNAFHTWARNPAPSDLVVYMTDHGGSEMFRLTEQETLGATELDAWMDDLQAVMTGRLTFVYDACQSGTFLSRMAAPAGKERVVITGASNEPAFFLEGGEISFSYQFWSFVHNGNKIGAAYDAGSEMVAAFQVPLVDADGDGVGNEPADADRIDDLLIGWGHKVASDIPAIGTTCGDKSLSGESSSEIWVSDVTDANGINRVWAVIIPPTFSAEPDEPVISLNKLPLIDMVGTGTYEGTYNGFTTPGAYRIVLYASDKQGHHSLPKMLRFEQVQGVTVATPAFSPGPGVYTTAQSVTLSCATGGAVIRYTTDGSEPTESAAVYTGPIVVSGTSTIKARGFKEGMSPSGTATGLYTVTGTVATPTFAPEPGFYAQPLDVSLSCATGGATIRYTLDGSDPTQASTPYYGTPIPLTAAATIRAKAFKVDWDPSATAVGVYLITAMKGDVDGDGDVDLKDGVICLKVLAGLDVSGQLRDGYPDSGADVNGDGTVGMAELIHILAQVAG